MATSLTMNNTTGNITLPVENTKGTHPALLVFFTLVVVLGLPGNILIIITVHKITAMQTVTNYLLENVAAADILTLLFSTLQYALISQSTLHEGALGSFLCKFVTNNSVALVALLASLLTLTILATERYQALLYPFQDLRRLSIENMRYIIAGVWLVAIAVSSPLFIYMDYVESKRSCYPSGNLHHLNIYIYCLVVIFIILPSLIIGFCYFRILSGLYFTNTIWNSASSGHTVEEVRAKRRLIQLLVIVTVMFFIAFVPYGTSLILGFDFMNNPSSQAAQTLRSITLTSQVLVLVNASANVFIYAFQSQNYRHGFKEVIRWILCRR